MEAPVQHMYRWIFLVFLLLFFFGQYGSSSYAVTAQGNTLYVNGPLGSGISREVAGALRSHDIKPVVLDSPGGLLVEGEAIAAMIRQLELDTVKDNRCGRPRVNPPGHHRHEHAIDQRLLSVVCALDWPKSRNTLQW